MVTAKWWKQDSNIENFELKANNTAEELNPVIDSFLKETDIGQSNIDYNIKITIANEYADINTKTKEKLNNLWYNTESLNNKEMAIIESVENHLWKYLDNSDKDLLIKLLWVNVEILKKPKEKIENNDKYNNISKEIKESPEFPIIERYKEIWYITQEEFNKIIDSKNIITWIKENIVDERNIKIYRKIDKIKNNSINKIKDNDFEKDFWWKFDWKEDSLIFEELSTNYINIWENNDTDKRLNLIATIQRVLEKYTKVPSNYRPYTYYEAVDYIRKEPVISETVNDILDTRLNKLAYVIWTVTWKNPFKNQTVANAEKENNTQKEKSIDEEKKNENYDIKLIRSLVKKNEDSLENKATNEWEIRKQKLAEIAKAEQAYKATNNIDIINASQIEQSA